MTIEAWKRVDRADLLEQIRVTVASGAGPVLALSLTDYAGRQVATDLSEDFVKSLGYTVVRVYESALTATSMRDLLVDAWRHVDPATPGAAVPRSVSQGRVTSEREAIREIATACGQQGPTAFLFDTIDSNSAIPKFQTRLFRDLALATSSPVIVVSRHETGTKFDSNIPTLALGSMDVDEIRASLLTSPYFAHVRGSHLLAALTEIEAGAVGSEVNAMLAYDVVQAWTETYAS